MRAIMADNDVLGQMQILVQLLNSEAWRDIWASLNLGVRTFAELGLRPDESDAVVWAVCQSEEIILITGNRNRDGPDSLEATIQSSNLPTSLPVFTLADPDQVLGSRAYAHRVVESMLQALLEIDTFRGAGRLWLP
jgi:hypothetical protein